MWNSLTLDQRERERSKTRPEDLRSEWLFFRRKEKEREKKKYIITLFYFIYIFLDYVFFLYIVLIHFYVVSPLYSTQKVNTLVSSMVFSGLLNAV